MEKNTLYLAADLAAMPWTRAELEHDRAEFTEACRRAEAKGDCALELMRSRQCNPGLNLSISRALAGDYDVRGSK